MVTTQTNERPGHRPNRAFTVERLWSKSNPLGHRLPSGRRQVAARSLLGDQIGRRPGSASSIYRSVCPIMAEFKALLNALHKRQQLEFYSNFVSLKKCPKHARKPRSKLGGKEPAAGTPMRHPQMPRRSPTGCRAISLKSSGGRWETARESVGHQSVTAGTSRGEAPRFCPVLT